MTDVEFSASPLKNFVNNMRIDNYKPTLREIFTARDKKTGAMKYNLTELFKKDLSYRMAHGLNVNIYIIGLQGTGKSTIGRWIKYQLDKLNLMTFDARDICFTRTEVLDRFKTIKPRCTLINDEDYDFVTQMGSTRVREQMELIEQVIRMDQINFISCSVSRVPHLLTYKLEALDIDHDNNLNRVLVFDKLGADSYNAVPIGFLLFSTRELPVQFEKEYLAKKREFLDKVKQGTVRNLAEKFSIMAEALIKEYNFKPTTPAKFLKVAVREMYPHVSENEIEELVVYVQYSFGKHKFIQKNDEVRTKAEDGEVVEEVDDINIKEPEER